MIRSLRSTIAPALLLAAGLLLPSSRAAAAEDAAAFTPEAIQFFESKVRPLFIEQCHSCHSNEAKKLKAHLLLDSREAILKGGDTGPAIVPGDPAKSLLIESISYTNVDLQMPPKKKLSDQQIADLTKWVQMGAPWPKETAKAGAISTFDLEKRKLEAWAFQPIKPQPVPAVKKADWVRTPIDAFILAKLDAKNIAPAPAADRRTLIRRVYFDLIGLPPSAEQVEAFVNDASADAFAKVVDSLLASPHFGEKWARHWLDLVRFAETCGHEFDYPLPHAWRYRDYVIRAFNNDLPYDQFTTEHIAGDLLKNPRRNSSDDTNESIVATGFWHLHEAVHAPVDVRLDEAIRVDNQLDVFSKSFLGLTVACARCHDHKFDPISTKDFYALAGFLQSSRRQEALLDPHRKIESTVKQIQELRAKADALVVRSIPAVDKMTTTHITQYLLAARETLTGKPKTSTKPAEKDIVFEDFETGDYRNWTATGTAFGEIPQTQKTIGNYQGNVAAQGTFFVNSHNLRAKGNNDVTTGDGHKGTLTSKPFTIERNHITFLIGGGAHEKQTCLNLLVDGKIVRSATGANNNQMAPGSLDVTELRGKKAQLQLVDDHAGGWGNIGLDHIVFTNRTGPQDVTVVTLPIEEVARDRQLDAHVLAGWVKALQSEDAKKPSHPLNVWNRFIKSGSAPADLQKTQAEVLSEIAAARTRANDAAQKSPLLTDFTGPDFGDWFTTGEAFGSAPTQQRQWDPVASSLAALTPGIAHSGLISPRLRGTLRSPTFTITGPQIHYKILGKGAQIRLIIDGYVMDVYNGLLFSDISFSVDTKGKWQWRTQGGDLRKYIGHRAYIEIIDDGDGFIAVDEIRFGDAPGNIDTPLPLSETILKAPPITTLNALASSYATAFASSISGWHTGNMSEDQNAVMLCITEHQLLAQDKPAATNQRSAIDALSKQIAPLAATVPDPVKVPALAEGSGENEFVFIRGSHKNLGDEVPRRLLEAIAPKQAPITQGSGRLELAQRVVDPANPFISRVIVNRLWHHLFGRGIVPTVDDFGFMGLPPSHGELLDWLATDFIRQGWSIKRALRQMVLSNVYQQASRIEPGHIAEQADPTNELLHRFPIRRLQAEAIRDAMLTISGRLDRAVGGPSVPVHLTAFMDGRGRPGGSGPLDGNGRRSLYMEIRRNFLPPMMLAFDFPSPFSTMGRRTVSNVPAQALILMNDPFVIEQAKRWATRILDGKGTADERITRMYESALARPPGKDELTVMLAFIGEQAKLYNAKEDDLRVWTDVAHVMFNMKAFVFVD